MLFCVFVGRLCYSGWSNVAEIIASTPTQWYAMLSIVSGTVGQYASLLVTIMDDDTAGRCLAV